VDPNATKTRPKAETRKRSTGQPGVKAYGFPGFPPTVAHVHVAPPDQRRDKKQMRGALVCRIEVPLADCGAGEPLWVACLSLDEESEEVWGLGFRV
jgi:hypothetical protein